MPIVLSQRTWRDDPKYLDREWVVYHYPDRYRSRVRPYDRFIYHRPTKGASKAEQATYFGHGMLGVPYEDWRNAGHWYVDIEWSERFPAPVPLRDFDGIYFETESAREPQFQFYAMREISPTAYFRILAAARVSMATEFSPLVTAESVMLTGYVGRVDAPVDAFRIAAEIPQGTGYRPQGNQPPSPYETAALQERARKDHQNVLESIRKRVASGGGVCFYNNNIDLYARVGEQKFLIEAKSLTDPRSAVDRMRYGIGQLFDYGVRYRTALDGAEPVLAFGNPPARDVAWIPSVLDDNGIAFVTAIGERIVPLNDRAMQLPFIS